MHRIDFQEPWNQSNVFSFSEMLDRLIGYTEKKGGEIHKKFVFHCVHCSGNEDKPIIIVYDAGDKGEPA